MNDVKSHENKISEATNDKLTKIQDALSECIAFCQHHERDKVTKRKGKKSGEQTYAN